MHRSTPFSDHAYLVARHARADVGRLRREYHAKRELIVYDYVDPGVPLLARMALKRQTGYRGLGFEILT